MFLGSLVTLAAAASGGEATACSVSPLVWQSLADAPTVKVWVFLRDKGYASPEDQIAAIDCFGESYPSRAVERRRLRRDAAGLFDDRDLPVNPEYLCAIEETGVR